MLSLVLLTGLSIGAVFWAVRGRTEENGSGGCVGPVVFADSERLLGRLSAASESENEVLYLRIVLDPGHGGSGANEEQELGAMFRGTYEKYLTLEIAKALREELSQYGNIEIFMTRETDRALTLKERAEYAKAVDADLLVSLHLNASLEHNFYGSEIFVSAFGEYYAKGAGVGGQILEQLTDCGFVSKGVKTRLRSRGDDYYGIIRESRDLGIPAVLVEHGYMDEDSDWARMDTAEKLAGLGRRDAAGIAAFYGLKKGENLLQLCDTQVQFPENSPVQPDTTPPEEVWCSLRWQKESSAGFLLHAVEKESCVMYYDYSVDGGETYSSLKLWQGGDIMEAECPVTGEEALRIRFRIYNNYELRTETAI